jgi:predicted ATPase
VEVAQRLMEAFRGAVWFVALEDLRDGQRIPDLIGEALGLARAAGVAPLSRVVAALGRRPCLLVLDSFEPLLASAEGGPWREEAAAAPDAHPAPAFSRSAPRAPHSAVGLVRALLREAAGLVCLATSRRALGMEEERQFPVPLLAVPPGPLPPAELAACESVQLFVDRAQGVRPDFQLTERNAGAVADLCARLEGIPLAIELAAARVRLLTPSQMIHQLGRAPGARLGLLAGRRPGVEPRHSTLRDTVDWSYQLLSDDLRRLFARLSVFRGGFTLEAATSIADCGAQRAPGIADYRIRTDQSAIRNLQSAMDSLEALRDSSLLSVEAGPEAEEPRFRMLETLREFAAEQLEPEAVPAAAAAHAGYFLGLVERAQAELHGPGQARWFERLEREHDNLHAAIEYCLGEGEWDPPAAGGDARPRAPIPHPGRTAVDRDDAALRLAARLWRFWLVRCHVDEGRRCLAAALARTGSAESRVDRAEALLGAGVLARSVGDHAAARQFLEESLGAYRELGNEEGAARALANLGIAWRERGDLGSARTRIEEALAILRRLGRRRYVAIYLVDLAHVLRQQGHPAAARAVLEESLGIERQLGDTWGIAAAAGALAVACAAAGDAAQARALYQETLALGHELGDRRCIAGTQLRLALLAWEQNEAAAAGASLREALPVYRQFAELLDLDQGLALAAALAAAAGQAEPAARLLGAAAVFREAASAPATGVPPVPLEPLLRTLRATLGEVRFAAAWTAGRGLSLAESVDLALAATWAGAAAQGPG